MQDMSDSAQATKRVSPRAKIASVIFAVPRRVHSHVSSRTNSELYGLAKTTIVIMAAVLPTVVGFVIVLQAMLNSPILMDPISVPESYEKNGYSSEAATQRLLDEIANINSISIGGKPKTDVGDTSFLGDVAATQVRSGLIDARSVQTLIRRFSARISFSSRAKSPCESRMTRRLLGFASGGRRDEKRLSMWSCREALKRSSPKAA